MPVALHSAKVDHDGRVRVIHTFLAANEAEAIELQKKHAGGCKAYGPALEKEETIDIVADVDTLPDATEESIEQFLDLESDESEDEEIEEEEAEEEEEEK